MKYRYDIHTSIELFGDIEVLVYSIRATDVYGRTYRTGLIFRDHDLCLDSDGCGGRELTVRKHPSPQAVRRDAYRHLEIMRAEHGDTLPAFAWRVLEDEEIVEGTDNVKL
jgi:hypothetical protein